MAEYTIKIFTGDHLTAGTFNATISVTLVGEDGKSVKTEFTRYVILPRSMTPSPPLPCPEPIGKLGMIKLEKQPIVGWTTLDWFIDKIEVTSPEGQVYTFPLYYWIKDDNFKEFREGTAVIVESVFQESRQKELEFRAKKYVWEKYEEGLPYCVQTDDNDDLPPLLQFSFTKHINFIKTAAEALATMNGATLSQLPPLNTIKLNLSNLLELFNLSGPALPWNNFDEIETVYNRCKTDMSDYVKENWKEDAFFGYQFLNGLNPILIRRCSSLPSNFPVTDDMVALQGGVRLTEEMQKGNIFLCDYQILDGVKANVINGKQQYLAAPLVLLHKTEKELKPVAIQLKQKGEDNPIFLPSDSEYDWLTAKTFVRSADFNFHELNTHLLRTHLLAEVFTVSLHRNLAAVHPLYKLLRPHTRYTLQINVLARQLLISDDGVFDKYIASGGEAKVTILRNAMSALTYTSLCLPDDIKDRGVESVPNYYYRNDGRELWNIINRFVRGVLTYYYQSDQQVQEDTELQNYIKDIFEYGFLSNSDTGIPPSFSKVDDVVKFVTMVIFTSSAQHAAVNYGQLDLAAWIPNLPVTLQCPLPTRKGDATEKTLLNTLPDVNASVNVLAILWLLSKQPIDRNALGEFPSEYFTEEVPLSLIKTFQTELKDLEDVINRRNASLKYPYVYLKPTNIENSIVI